MNLTFIISLLFLFSEVLFAQTLLTQKKTFKLENYQTELGKTIPSVQVGYETYGTLNQNKSNAILISHFFSGNSHAAGKYLETDIPSGYWDNIIGPGKLIDTNKFFIISSDSLVNIAPKNPMVVTTGPMTINPRTKKTYGLIFPHVSVVDMVRVQQKLIEHLGIDQLEIVMGASGGAAQALEWAVQFPDKVKKVAAVIPPGLEMPSYVILMLNTWMTPIKLDPKWKKGNYHPDHQPLDGIKASLKLIQLNAAHFNWAQNLAERAWSTETNPLTGLNYTYEVETKFDELALKRAQYVDANSLLYTAKAIQSFSVRNRFTKIKAKILFIPAEKDFIFPVELSLKAQNELCAKNIKAQTLILKGDGGHLDGITKMPEVQREFAKFMNDELKFCQAL